MNENQKKVTDQYRSNWDDIFGKKKSAKEELAERILKREEDESKRVQTDV